MNGEAFNLTPHDIRKQEFRKTLRGYDTLGGDDFSVRVADALERAIRERQILEERVNALTEQLREFRTSEKPLTEGLLAHQHMSQIPHAPHYASGQVIL